MLEWPMFKTFFEKLLKDEVPFSNLSAVFKTIIISGNKLSLFGRIIYLAITKFFDPIAYEENVESTGIDFFWN